MQIRIHPSFCLYLLCYVFLSSFSNVLGILLALLIHELSHYAAARLIGEQIALLELTPFGGVMRYKPGSISSKGLKGVFLHAAGPLGNYAFLLAASMPMMRNLLPYDFQRSLILANSSMLFLNLLPAFPLDGGQVLFCLGYYLFPVAKLAAVLTALGIITGSLGLILSVYGLILHRMLNCSLLIVSLYLIVVAAQSRSHLLCENICAVAQEKLSDIVGIERIRYYRAAHNTPLLDLIPLMKPGIAMHVSFINEGKEYELTDIQLCQALLTMPSSVLLEAYLHFSQYKEKKSAIP